MLEITLEKCVLPEWEKCIQIVRALRMYNAFKTYTSYITWMYTNNVRYTHLIYEVCNWYHRICWLPYVDIPIVYQWYSKDWLRNKVLSLEFDIGLKHSCVVFLVSWPIVKYIRIRPYVVSITCSRHLIYRVKYKYKWHPFEGVVP